MCILIVENYALFEALLRTITWESAFQLALRNCSKEVKEEPGYSGIFTGRKKKLMQSNIKRLLLVTKTDI